MLAGMGRIVSKLARGKKISLLRIIDKKIKNLAMTSASTITIITIIIIVASVITKIQYIKPSVTVTVIPLAL